MSLSWENSNIVNEKEDQAGIILHGFAMAWWYGNLTHFLSRCGLMSFVIEIR